MDAWNFEFYVKLVEFLQGVLNSSSYRSRVWQNLSITVSDRYRILLSSHVPSGTTVSTVNAGSRT
jgi:hypothetical protein